MRTAIATAALLLLGATPQHRLFKQPNLPSGGYALFEFAPASGAGMGTACACTTPTGAKGEVMTFTRASTAWCTKGNETSGIVNGDLVECASGQPRVMPGGDGTGGNGLAVWEARTNTALRSIALDDVAWVLQNLGAALPTRTANYAVAPDGTTTAERLEFAASAATQYSRIYQADGCPLATSSAGLYIKGTTTSGTIDVCLFGVNEGWRCTACAFVAGTWSRCLNENKAFTGAGTRYFAFGNDTLNNGGTTRVANDVLVWQADCQAGATIGPPITTAGTSATRVVEVPYLTLPTAPAATGVYSVAATVTTSKASTLNWAGATIYDGTGQPYVAMYNNTNMKCEQANVSVYTATRAALGPIATDKRIVCWNDGVTEQGIYDGTAFATPATGSVAAATAKRAYLGTLSTAGFELNGVIKRVCADPGATRCR